MPPARFGLFGHVVALDQGAADCWAARLAAAAPDGRGRVGGASPPAGGAELIAAVTLHELMHELLASAAAAANQGPLDRVLAVAGDQLDAAAGAGAAASLAQRFDDSFVKATEAGAPRAGESAALGGGATAALALEELLLLEASRRNPALVGLASLFDEPALFGHDDHATAVAVLEDEFGKVVPRVPGVPAVRDGLAGGRLAGRGDPHVPNAGVASGTPATLLELLFAPQLRAPSSLLEQLRLAAELWRPYISAGGELALARALRAFDVAAEFANRAGPGPAAPEPVSFGGSHAPRAFADGEGAFSPDADWMPSVALVTKSAHVWLAQLSRAHGTDVRTLADVPDTALQELAEDGFNALWLVGIWERSEASARVKRAMGQGDALASAYSIFDYRVADALGGDAALEAFAERASRHGVRLASDMVPNHTAIDAAWVIEHPEWFVQTSEPPYPTYSYTGPDLAADPRVAIRIEDGYYDGSDAAVAFERLDTLTGERRYLYHGNDGTGLPWNDTAQLDFLVAEAREAVIRTTIDVARRFSLIRLDAAMTLAKKHVRRLWHPEPGEGGAVPSRSRLALPADEFERLMPREFWRELVDRVNAEAPDTLLMAEAFWLMEEYFVRSLGMHRVYNSAFMHFARQEQNAEHRAYLKKYLVEEPRVLGTFVNYLSNPDEEPVVVQFPNADKEFAVTTLMVTLPGLPLFAHGQVGGLAEQYGMEFARPRWEEEPHGWHVSRHRAAITPLLRARRLFAGSDLFRLFDFREGSGGRTWVREDVFAFSNGAGDERVFALVNNSARPARGTVTDSAPFRGPGREERPKSVSVADALLGGPGEAVLTPLAGGPELHVTYAGLLADGLSLELGPYEAVVYKVVRSAGAGAQPEAPVVRATTGRREAAGAVLGGRRGVAKRRAVKRRRR